MLRILQVNTEDQGGGAASIAWNLFQAYRLCGHESWMAVGQRKSQDPQVLLIPNLARQSRWTRFWKAAQSRLERLEGRVWGCGWISRRAGGIAEPGKSLDGYLGHEDFHFSGTRCLMSLTILPPDIIHCHNLHGGYFDIRIFPSLSRQTPVILTLHDAWLLSGHCAHSLGCERWKTGCGRCPDLAIYPAIRRDGTAFNWRRKQAIFARSRLYVSTPSWWLMQKVEKSMLAPAVVEARVIPNGIDLAVFQPRDKQTVRFELELPQDAAVLLFSANNVRQNMWKDYQTIRAAIDLVSQQWHGQKVLFIALGEGAAVERSGRVELRFVPYQKDPATVARYYQAADVYVHAAHADTFPNTVLEAMACGTPVVATAVGGIPEQVDEARTGFLVPAGDAQALATRLMDLLSDDVRRKNMGIEAAEDACRRFDLRLQVDAYLEWYQALVQHEEPAPLINEV